MRMPGYTAESATPRSSYLQRDARRPDRRDSVALPQLGFHCAGRYCDCDGSTDCADMINHKCGGWTRCVVIAGRLRCLCEPRAAQMA